MFGKKYVFETRKTRAKRYLFNIVLILGTLLFLYTSLCLAVIFISQYEANRSKEAFYKRAPDLIAIFTGDAGRISYGLRKAIRYQAPQILITGVYTSNSIRGLLLQQDRDLLNKINLNSSFIEIDYLARNTVENVISTLRLLRKNPDFYHNILIISSDYHIMRIKIILYFTKSATDHFDFYFMGSDSNYHEWHNIKILSKEVIKTIKTFAFLLIWDWDTEFSQQQDKEEKL